MFITLKNKSISHGLPKGPWLTLGLTAVMVALFAAGLGPFENLLFDKKAVVNGEFWRFITGHFVHCNFEHLFWDMAAFVIIGTVIELNSLKHLMGSFIMSCLFVSLWLIFGESSLATYCGLSGALNGLLVVAAVMHKEKTGRYMSYLMLAATAAKILFELITHQTIFTHLSVQAMPMAHAAGFVGGILYVAIIKIVPRLTANFDIANVIKRRDT